MNPRHVLLVKIFCIRSMIDIKNYATYLLDESHISKNSQILLLIYNLNHL